MINEERTLEDFGHTSDMLTNGSGKRVWRICEGCGKEDDIRYCDYTIGRVTCQPCAAKRRAILVRGPFNIEYFEAVQESIVDAYINDLRTFDMFKYYSIDLSDGSNERVLRICSGCGKEESIIYQAYMRGQRLCRSCGNTGIVHSEESKKKMSEKQIGKIRSDETRRKISIAKKGTKHSDGAKAKISIATSGKNNPFYGKHHSEESKKLISDSATGRTHSEESKKKISIANTGKNNYNYNPNLTDSERVTRRKTLENTIWSLNVKLRDAFTCQKCGNTKRRLVSHHILGYTAYPNSRFDLDNGITLCEECHNEFHHLYSYKYFTDLDFFIWIK